ncbi:MAG: Asp-tRNA(Asn)/Glu-tRNA(Gln) amidotransferase subunit GatC [Patescibacteria group bacterium]
MDDILNYVKQLQKVDTTKVLPLTDTSGLKNVTRKDVVEPQPELLKGHVKVKAIFENE